VTRFDDQQDHAVTSLTTIETEAGLAVVHPATGAQLLLSAPDEQLVAWLHETRDVESKMRELKGLITREVYARLDSRAKWSATWGGYKVKGESPEPTTEYDGQELAKTLRRLVRRKLIDAEAAAAACEKVTTWKPKKNGINALLKLGGEVKEAIDAIASVKPRDRKAPSVTPASPGGTSTE